MSRERFYLCTCEECGHEWEIDGDALEYEVLSCSECACEDIATEENK